MCADHCEFTTSFWDVIWPKAEGQNFDKHGAKLLIPDASGDKNPWKVSRVCEFEPVDTFFFFKDI